MFVLPCMALPVIQEQIKEVSMTKNLMVFGTSSHAGKSMLGDSVLQNYISKIQRCAFKGAEHEP